MRNDIEAELKRVEARSKTDGGTLRRDLSMTGGEKAETPTEKANQKKRSRRPKEPPIIQRTP